MARARGELFDPAQHEMIFGRQFGAPTMLDDHGLVRLDDDGRAIDLVAGRELSRV